MIKQNHVDTLKSLILCAFLCTAVFAEEININSNYANKVISPYVNGMHFVYCMESDSIYADGRVATWAKDRNIGTARFPGGTTVKYWNWDNPTGVLKGDRWDPNNDPLNDQPEELWMSIDEYLDFCTQAEVTPLMGVNIHSGEVNNRRVDSVQRAVDQVQYTIDKGWDIEYWYLGNEDGWTASKMATVINAHANAMRQVKPNIKIIVTKNKPATYDYYYNLMLQAGNNIDAVECHFKWGNSDGLSGQTYEAWRTQSPISDGKIKTANYDLMKNACVDAGYPNTLIMMNEWGPGSALLNMSLGEFDKYSSSLVMVDMLVEIYRTGYDMACYWNAQWNGNNGFSAKPNGHLMDSTNGYTFNPVAQGFNLVQTLKNQNIWLGKIMPSDLVYGFATRNSDTSRIQLFLMNKNNVGKNLTISSSLVNVNSANAFALQSPGDIISELLVSQISLNQVSVTLPALSFTRITLKGIQGSESGMRLECLGQINNNQDYRLGVTGGSVNLQGSAFSGDAVQWLLVPATGGDNLYYIENVAEKNLSNPYKLAASTTNGSLALYGGNSTGDWVKWELKELVQGYQLNNVGARSAGQDSRLRGLENGGIELSPDWDGDWASWDVR